MTDILLYLYHIDTASLANSFTPFMHMAHLGFYVHGHEYSVCE